MELNQRHDYVDKLVQAQGRERVYAQICHYRHHFKHMLETTPEEWVRDYFQEVYDELDDMKAIMDVDYM